MCSRVSILDALVLRLIQDANRAYWQLALVRRGFRTFHPSLAGLPRTGTCQVAPKSPQVAVMNPELFGALAEVDVSFYCRVSPVMTDSHFEVHAREK